jgi:hypothetical protein
MKCVRNESTKICAKKNAIPSRFFCVLSTKETGLISTIHYGHCSRCHNYLPFLRLINHITQQRGYLQLVSILTCNKRPNRKAGWQSLQRTVTAFSGCPTLLIVQSREQGISMNNLVPGSQFSQQSSSKISSCQSCRFSTEIMSRIAAVELDKWQQHK